MQNRLILSSPKAVLDLEARERRAIQRIAQIVQIAKTAEAVAGQARLLSSKAAAVVKAHDMAKEAMKRLTDPGLK